MTFKQKVGSEEVFEVKWIYKTIMLTLDFSHIRLVCLIAWFLEQDQKYCSGKSGATSKPDIRLCLMDQAHAR